MAPGLAETIVFLAIMTALYLGAITVGLLAINWVHRRLLK